MLFASFLASKWRWPAFALAIIFAVLSQMADRASTWWGHRRLAEQVRATEAAHAARAAAEPAQVHHFDSTLYSLIGQHHELQRQQAQTKKQDEALTRALPAAPALPADPPRQ